MDKIKALNLLGLAYRAKKIVNGEENVIMNLQKGKCKVVIIASDASSRTLDMFEKKCFFYNVKLVKDFSSDELSKALGKTLVKDLAIIDQGFSDAFFENLK